MSAQARIDRITRLLGNGYTVAGVAKAIGLTPRQVFRILEANPEIREQAAELLAERDPDAVEVLRQLMRSDDERIRLQAAVALLKTPPPEEPDTTPGGIIVYAPKLEEEQDEREAVA